MRIKMIAGLLVLCICITLIPFRAEAVSTGQCGNNVYYSFDETKGLLEITGTGKMWDYTYKDDNKNRAPWGDYADFITSVQIDDGVKSIGAAAFAYCRNLKSVTIGSSVFEVHKRAFLGCSALTTISVPDSVGMIEDYAFSQSGLADVTLSENVYYFGEGIFSETPIRRIVIPELVNTVSKRLFYNCPNLETVYFMGHLTDVGSEAFYNTPLREIYFVGGLSGTIDYSAFKNCSNLTSFRFSDEVTEIRFSAFENCIRLSQMTFEGDAPAIGQFAFGAVVADAYYPADNATWTKESMQHHGGRLTWKSYDASFSSIANFVSISTSLGGNIAMNFYVELSHDLFSDPGAYIQFAYDYWMIQVPLNKGTLSRENTYRFSCPLTSKNMTDEITAQIYSSSGTVLASKSMSVDTYCNWVIENTKDTKTVNLMKAMLNYGASAQRLFNYRTEDLANAALAEEDKVLTAVDASAYAHSRTGEEDGIKPVSYTLLLDSETTVRCYFELTGDKPIEAFTFTVDGEKVTPRYRNGRYYIQKQNIAAHRLDDTHVFTCGDITITYGGLSYVNQVMSNYTEGTTFDMASALYAYSKAAEAYIGTTVDQNPGSSNTKLSLSQSSISMQAEESVSLTVTYDGDPSNLRWFETTEAIVSVYYNSVDPRNNLIKAGYTAGTTIIGVTDGTVIAYCTVTVSIDNTYPTIEGFTPITEENTSIPYEGTLQLEYRYTGNPEDLIWKAQSPDVLTVDQKGLVTACPGVGSDASYVDVYCGDTRLYSWWIYVEEKLEQPEIGPTVRMILNNNDGSWRIGCLGNTMTFNACARDENNYYRPITAVSSDTDVAIIYPVENYGMNWTTYQIFYIGVGTATITITSDDGWCESFTVNVQPYEIQDTSTPEAFAAACNYVIGMNGTELHSGEGGAYLYLWLDDEDLTWKQAVGQGQGMVHRAWQVGAEGAFAGCFYQGIDPENGKHLFFIYAY